jgi:hypothetical protein
MVVQDFDHKQAQAMFSGQGGNLAPEKGIDRLWAFLGGYLVWWRSLLKWRLVAEGLLYDWPGDAGLLVPQVGMAQKLKKTRN